MYTLLDMFEHVAPDKVKDIDNTDLPLVAFNNRLELFRLYVENRNVDLKTAFYETPTKLEDNYHLIPAFSQRHGMDNREYQVFWAILYIDSDLLARYLVQKGLIPEDRLIPLIRDAISGHHYKVLGELLQDPRLSDDMILKLFNDEVMKGLIPATYNEILAFLTRKDINYPIDSIFLYGAGYDHIDLVYPYLNMVDQDTIDRGLSESALNHCLDIFLLLLPLATCEGKIKAMNDIIRYYEEYEPSPEIITYILLDSCVSSDQIDMWIKGLFHGIIMGAFIRSGRLTPEQINIIQQRYYF